ncbi:MAG TPA: hypothetical protein VER33_08835 [Polyangiaceae bacterium]|nr:hypothetical protein [Polyangiaceae bacterium]
MATGPVLEDPARASARVLESAIALGRAELKLVASQALVRARLLGTRAAKAVALTWLAMTLVQITLALLVIAPFMVSLRSWPAVLTLLGPAVVLAVIAGVASLRQWQQLARATSSSAHQTASEAGKARNELPA